MAYDGKAFGKTMKFEDKTRVFSLHVTREGISGFETTITTVGDDSSSKFSRC